MIDSLLLLELTEVLFGALVQGGLIILEFLLIWIAHRISNGPLKRLIENKMDASIMDGSKRLNMGANGEVLEITFTTVKGQIIDNITTTIPTYSIIKLQNFENITTTIPIYSTINEYFNKW